MSGGRRKLLLQIAVSVLLLLLLWRRIDLGEGAAALGRLRGQTLAAALALSFLAYAGRAARWWMLLRRAGVRVGAWTSYRLTLVGYLRGGRMTIYTHPGRIERP